MYLVQEGGCLKGQLRMISRTQSEILYDYLNSFIQMWETIENESSKVIWEVEQGSKWLRKLSLEAYQQPDCGQLLASMLSKYITILDEGLKLYFTHLDNPQTQYRKLNKYYHERYRQMGGTL